jgi:hypothetical protein
MLGQGVLYIARLILLLEFMDYFGPILDYNSYKDMNFQA